MGINPPVDRQEAIASPKYVYQDRTFNVEIRMGPDHDGPDRFRYVVIYTGVDREVWEGYLYLSEETE